MKLLFLPKYTSSVGSSRLRTYIFISELRKYFDINVLPLMRSSFNFFSLPYILFRFLNRMFHLFFFDYDLVIIEKELFPWLPYRIERFFLKNNPYILDIDDAIFIKYEGTINEGKIESLAANSLEMHCGSYELLNYFKNLSKVFFLPTPIPNHLFNKLDKKINNRIVWIGQQGSIYSLEVYAQEIVQFCEDYDVEFLIIGGKLKDIQSENIRYLDWSSENEYLALTTADFGIMPLELGRFEQYKCSYKMLQYLSVGLYPLVSYHGENKYLVNKLNLLQIEGSWYKALEKGYNQKLFQVKLSLPDEYYLSSVLKEKKKRFCLNLS